MPNSSNTIVRTSLFAIAVGAILRYAVTVDVSWIDVQTAGVVLMVIGTVGLLIGPFLMLRSRPGAPRDADIH
jgi:hypothetical protein